MKIFLWGLVLVPFMVDNYAFFPYVTGESLFARGVLVIVSILFLVSIFYNRSFKNEIKDKLSLIIKKPLFISLLIFILIFITSTIFAVNGYNAFWGTIERAEGLIGLSFFFSAFIYSFLIFGRKDWFIFFKLNLLVSFILLFKEFIQFYGGVIRPTSFLDNPTFLAGYLLFSIFCAIAVFSEEKYKFWKYFSVLTLFLSIIGILITETRGTMAGIVIASIVALIYGFFKGKNILIKNISLQKISIILLCFILLSGTIFISTRKNQFWQKVPGLSRVALISGKDSTTQTRLLTAKLSLRAIDPIQNGFKKFMIGWGPENFSLAYGKYFNPVQFDYEAAWFDRSHNKLLDVLVMNGLLGLIAYLSICFFFIKSILKRKDFSLLDLGLIFFLTSYLVHLLFVFDQITTSIPFFLVIAFVLYLSTFDNADNSKINKVKLIKDIYIYLFFIIFSIFLSFIFLRNDLPASIQMRKYISLRQNGNTDYILENINSVFEPFTAAQMNIRDDFLTSVDKNYNKNDKAVQELSNIAIYRAEEYAQKDPMDIRFLAYLASAYSNKGKELKDGDLLSKGEFYFRKMVDLSPNRPDSNYGLALNLFFQKKYDESFMYYERALTLNIEYMAQIKNGFDQVYSVFFQYFYKTKNKDNFIRTAERLRDTNYISQDMLNTIKDYIEKNNSFPPINFK